MPSVLARHEGHSLECGKVQIIHKMVQNSNLLGFPLKTPVNWVPNINILTNIKTPVHSTPVERDKQQGSEGSC